MKNAIITACNAKHGDFLGKHWFKSIVTNVDMSNIDVVIMDYGLTKTQLKRLKGAKIVKGDAKGHIVTARFKDIANYLDKAKYEQVLVCDGGDIIFQTDISPIFTKYPLQIRAVVEERNCLFNHLNIGGSNYPASILKDVKRTVLTKNPINAGLYLGPRKKVSSMLHFCYDSIKEKGFGSDQVMFNYYLHKHGFKDIGCKYNFTIPLMNKVIRVNDSQIVFRDGELVPIVHNVGADKFRKIENFGFGKGFNKLRKVDYHLTRVWTWTANKIHLVSSFFHKL